MTEVIQNRVVSEFLQEATQGGIYNNGPDGIASFVFFQNLVISFRVSEFMESFILFMNLIL